MRILRRPEALERPCALCIGAFDGLHRGHRALLEAAARASTRVAILTFEPHPAVVLAPDRAPPRLQSPAQRARIAEAMGVHTLAEVPFNRDVASMDAAAFVDTYLVSGLRPTVVVVGEDFRFGRGAAGTTEQLRELLAAAGIELVVVGQVNDPSGEKIGSTEIRAHLAKGEVEQANQLLGHAFAVTGKVVPGARRGRTLGFPTANIAAEALRPATGVYAGYLTVHAGDDPLPVAMPAVANVGSNPTFADGASTTSGVEVHVLDAQLGESLYDRSVEFAFVARIRDEQRFDGAEALKAAIAQDIARGRELLASHPTTRRRPSPLVMGEQGDEA